MSSLLQIDRPALARWSLCAFFVLSAHIGGAAALLKEAPFRLLPDLASGGFVVELAATPTMRSDRPLSDAPGPEQVQAEAAPDAREVVREKQEQPLPVSDLRTAALPEIPGSPVTLPHPPERPAPPKLEPIQAAAQPQTAVAMTTSDQVQADRIAAIAAAPIQGVPGKALSNAVPTWQTKLVGQIGRQQRYPAAARAKQEQGITHLVFTIDRAGRLLEDRVVASSGSSVLDAEALAMLKRAQPFPPPPPELPGEQIMLPVPISFSLR